MVATEEPFVMRAPCRKCGGPTGRIEERGAQDCVFCSSCGAFQYNAPRTETGKKVRSVTTVHNGIKPNQRSRILQRATGRCELCGKRPETAALHVGHLLSVKDGLVRGLTELELNNDDNLCAMCDECNLGMGKQTVPLRLAVAMVMARLRTGAA
jgi:hypothetical protein